MSQPSKKMQFVQPGLSEWIVISQPKESKEDEKKEIKNEEKKEIKVNDDNSKKSHRSFNPEWIKSYPWLEYDETTKKMYCKWCRNKGFTNAMTEGSNRFRTSCLYEHEKTDDHKKASPAPINPTQLDKIITAKDAAITNLFKAALWLAEEALPSVKYEGVCNLLEKTGCVIPETLHRDRHSYMEFTHLISSVIENKILAQINSSLAYGIMLDESIDITQEEHLVIYAKYFDEKDHKFKTTFLKLVQITDKTGETIHKTVKTFLRESGLNIFKIVGVCTDGASNMSSDKHGFIGRFHLENNATIYTHCVVHRLSLALKDAIKEYPYIVKYESVLRNIHSYFSKSAKKTEQLRDLFEKNDKPFIKLPELFTIRWFSLYQVVIKLVKIYAEMYDYFEKQSNEDDIALAIFSSIKNSDFIFWTVYFIEILKDFYTLNKIFQSSDTSPYNVIIQIELLAEKVKNRFISNFPTEVICVIEEIKK